MFNGVENKPVHIKAYATMTLKNKFPNEASEK